MAMNLQATMSLDNSRFVSGLGAAMGSVTRFLGPVGTMVTALAGAAGVGLSVGAAFHGVKSAFDLGDALGELSARTGEGVANLQVMQKAFADAGLSAEQVGPSINLMQKALTGLNDEGQPTVEAFKKLGLSVDNLKGMSAKDQLESISKGIQGIQNPAERSRAAMEIFGRSGGQMLALMTDPSAMGNAATTIGKQAEILERRAQVFGRISELLGSAGLKLQGFFVGVADKIAPQLLQLLEYLNKIDLAGIGQEVGNVISTAMNIIKNGDTWDYISNSLQFAFGTGVNYLAGGIKSAVDILAATMPVLFSADFWNGLATGFSGVAAKFSAFMLTAFETPLTYVSAAMQWAFENAVGVIVTRMNPVFNLLNLMTGGAFGDKINDLMAEFGVGTGRKLAEVYEEQVRNKTLAMDAGDLNGKAQDHFRVAGDLLGKAGDKVAKAAQKIIDNYKPGKVVDTSENYAEMQRIEALALMGEALGGGTADQKKDTTPPPDKIQTPALGNKVEVLSDRLSRIGGFTGLANPATTAAQNTARNTSKMVAQLDRVIQSLSGDIAGGAVYA